MQQVATEMNLSETAFLYRQDDGYSLRWFTPAVEVDLCGHATLASAHIFWEAGHLQAHEQARFITRSGLLTADRKGDWIEMDFPAKEEEQADAPPDLLQALGVPVNSTAIHREKRLRLSYRSCIRRYRARFTRRRRRWPARRRWPGTRGCTRR